MISNRHVLITQVFACAAAAVASVGCGVSTAALRAPVQPSGVDAEVSSLGAKCTIVGAPHVLATHVAPYAGVHAQADASRVLLRFSQQRTELALALAVDPQSLDAVDGSELASARLVDARGLGVDLANEVTPVLWQGDGAEAIAAARRSEPSGDLRADGPVVVRVDAERWVSVWSAGSILTGMDVQVQTVDRHGMTLGAPVTLASDGRAFGTPTVAVAPSGRGVVAFLQSGDHGFELVASAIDCHVPAAPEMPAAWAMQTAH